MYGIIPSAKMVALLRFPPTNISYRPRTEPLIAWNAAASADVSTPGTGI